jgi:hypothetical protein
VRWVLIKARWNLTATTPEHAALANMIAGCPVAIRWPRAVCFSAPFPVHPEA